MSPEAAPNGMPPAVRPSTGRTHDAEQLAAEKIGMVQESAVIPEPGKLAMVALGCSCRDGNQLRLAGAAAGHREHQRWAPQSRTFASPFWATLDVSAQTFVVADFHLFAILVEIANRVEMMIAAEACGAIALDDIEQAVAPEFPADL